jgi:lysozyme
VVHGVDVSVYQGQVDWTQVRAAGIAFAFARVSDGTGYPDTEFASNWPAMKAAGVVRGAYQFFRPEEDPTAQANLFASMLTAAGGVADGDLPPVLDLEVTDNTPDATIQSRMQTWFSAMQAATGMTPMLYMSPSFAPHAGTAFAGHPLWIANWGAPCPSVPSPWSTWAFWQTSDMGTTPGVPATVDLDEFNGPLSELPVLGPTPGADGGSDGGPSADAAAGADSGDGASTPSTDAAPPPTGDAGAASDAASGGATMGSGGGTGGGTGACR